MAQNAKIADLTDELIQSILQFDPTLNRQAYRQAKDAASRAFREHRYARTNQFNVKAIFNGLDEKFRIKNRDDLADALQTRLLKLECMSHKFRPDILSFLLQVADRPLENTNVDALELLKPPEPIPEPTWAEILLDDPYSDEDIWKDVDYGGNSSSDEQTPRRQKNLKSSPTTSVEEDEAHNPSRYVQPVDASLVAHFEAAQFWNVVADEDEEQTSVTEWKMVRETIFMLTGLRTSLYQIDQEQHTIHIRSKYLLHHKLPSSSNHLLLQFAAIGKHIYRLRQWLKSPSELPLMQTFEFAIRTRLIAYDKSLAQMQQNTLTPELPLTVSLLNLYDDIQLSSSALVRLAQIVTDLKPQLLINPFSHLETLFDQAVLAQMTLDEETYCFMAKLFLECLQTYLKPIRKWVESGELGADDDTFFVFASDSSIDGASLWHDKYVLRRDGANKLRCPSFLQPAAQKIFNAGKTVVMLKEIGAYDLPPNYSPSEMRLDYQSVSEPMNILPFPELFNGAFEAWIRSKFSVASNVLRQHLYERDGLMRILTNFEMLYLSKNGAIFQDFANMLFKRIDAGKGQWSDRYILTEIAQEAFASAMPPSDVERIVVRCARMKKYDRSIKSLSNVAIEFALPWSIQNVIRRYSISTYQQVFTFILQLHRVKYLLQNNRTSCKSQLERKLQHRLVWFIDTFRSYITETVISFTIQEMCIEMEQAQDLDDMSTIHAKHVAKLHKRAILSEDLKPIHRAVVQVLDLVLLFTICTDTSTNMAQLTRKRKLKIAPHHRISANADGEALDSDLEEESMNETENQVIQELHRPSSEGMLKIMDEELAQLIPFIAAGLKNISQVGAEPMWGQLAERLTWEVKSRRL